MACLPLFRAVNKIGSGICTAVCGSTPRLIVGISSSQVIAAVFVATWLLLGACLLAWDKKKRMQLWLLLDWLCWWGWAIQDSLFLQQEGFALAGLTVVGGWHHCLFLGVVQDSAPCRHSPGHGLPAVRRCFDSLDQQPVGDLGVPSQSHFAAPGNCTAWIQREIVEPRVLNYSCEIFRLWKSCFISDETWWDNDSLNDDFTT